MPDGEIMSGIISSNGLPDGVSFRDESQERSPPSDSADEMMETPSSSDNHSLQMSPSRVNTPISKMNAWFAALDSNGGEMSLIPSRCPSPLDLSTEFAFLWPELSSSGTEVDHPLHTAGMSPLSVFNITVPSNTLSLFHGLDLPALQPLRGAGGQLSRIMTPSLDKSMPLLPWKSQHELQQKPFDAVFFHTIMFLLMNNFAGSDDIMLESLFQQLDRFSIPQMEKILDSIPLPFSEALQQSILTIAIKSGVVAIVKILLARGLDANRVTCRYAGSSYTPLGLACKFIRLEVVRLLLKTGVDVNQHHMYGDTPIFHLLGFQYRNKKIENQIPRTAREIFLLLLQANAKVGWRELETAAFWSDEAWLDVYLEHSKTPLTITKPYHVQRPLINAMNLLENDRVTRAVKVLLGRHFRLEQRWSNTTKTCFWGALNTAAIRNNVELVQFFLHAGVIPGTSCLAQAVRGDCPAIIELLLAAGVELDSVTIPYGDEAEAIMLPYAGTLPSKTDPLLCESYRVRHLCNSPFAEAIRCQHKDLLRMFEDRGIMSRIAHNSRFTAALVAAAEAGDATMTRSLLEVLARTPELMVPGLSLSISLAALGNHEDIVTMLMSAGIQPNAPSLTAAAIVRNASLVRLFLDTGAPPEERGLLYFAIRWAKITVIRDMITAGATMSDLGWRIDFLEIEKFWRETPKSPLGQAIEQDNQEIIDILLDHGANISEEGRTGFAGYGGFSPLSLAVKTGNERLVRELLARGAEPNDPVALLEATYHSVAMIRVIVHAFSRQYPSGKKYFASKALRRAIRAENIEQVNLLARYTDLNDREQRREETEEHEMRVGQYDEFLPTPLGEAIIGQNREVIQIILDGGGDPNSTVATKVRYPHRGRWTALLQAIHTNNLETVQLICNAGAQVNCEATLGIIRTPLQLAVEIGNLDIVQLLLDCGADVNAKPCIWGGGTAFQLAAIKGFVGIAELLLQHGADINAERCRFQGRAAFEGAAEHGRMDMLLLLYHKGVDLISDSGEQVRRAIELAEKNGQLAAKSLVEQLSQSSGVSYLIG